MVYSAPMIGTAERQPRGPAGRFHKEQTLIESVWNNLKATHPEVIAKYYLVPLSFIIPIARDEEALSLRARVSLVDVVERRYGTMGARNSLVEEAAGLGLSETGIYSLAEAALHCIAQETGVDIPRSPLAATHNYAKRIQKAVTLYNRLYPLLEDVSLTMLDKTALKYYLEGNTQKQIAAFVRKDMGFIAGFDGQQVATIIDSLQGRNEYRRLGRLAQRGMKAKELLSAEEQGTFRNEKAELSEQMLFLLAQGSTTKEVCVALGIDKNQYRALLWAIREDIKTHPESKKALQNIVDTLQEQRVNPFAGWGINRVYRELYEPYRLFRQQLGEKEERDGWLTVQKLSPFERKLLAGVAQGQTDKELATQYATSPSQMTVLIHEMLGILPTRRPAQLLQERQGVYERYLEGIENGEYRLPAELSYQYGLAAVRFLSYLANGKQYKEIAEKIRRKTGKIVGLGKLSSWFKDIRACFNDVKHMDK